jgi:hypothetical protein
MPDNDIYEGLVDAIRGQSPSQPDLPFVSQEEQLPHWPTAEEIVASPPHMTAPAPGILFGLPNDDHQHFTVSGVIDWQMSIPEPNIAITSPNGPSLVISPTGVITLNDGPSTLSQYQINLREQAMTIANLQQRLGSLEQIVNLLGTALNAQIDNNAMSALAPGERQAIRDQVAQRDQNQAARQQRLNERSMRARELFTPTPQRG